MNDAGDLPTIDYKALFAKVQANRDRLDACPRHFFKDLLVIPRQLGQKAECSVCKGELDLVAINYYVRGYEASGKSGNDIVPGWKEEPGNEPIKTIRARTFFKHDE
jgi:hypothetical protein